MAKESRGRSAFLLLILPALVASCRRASDDQAFVPPDQLANAIESVRVEKKEAPPAPPKRLAFLLPGDMTKASGDVICTLRQHERPVLLAGSARALARVDGHVVLLDRDGPMDASAAFFQAPGVTISIGRHAPVAREADLPDMAWPVGVSVGGRANVEDEKIDASWSCRMTQTLR